MGELFSGLHEVATGPSPAFLTPSPEVEAALAPALRARDLESRARLAFREGRGDEGLRQLEEAHGLHPRARSIARTLANAWIARGAVLANRGRISEAGTAYLSAIRVDPGFAEAFVRLGELYRDTGDAGRAMEAAQEARRLDPGDPDPPALEADLLARMRRFEEAVGAAEASLAREPSHEGALVALGDAWLGLGETARAESIYVAAFERHPGSESLAAKVRKAGSLDGGKPSR